MPREVERNAVSAAIFKSPGTFFSHEVKQTSQPVGYILLSLPTTASEINRVTGSGPQGGSFKEVLTYRV